MASGTTVALLENITAACDVSEWVETYEVLYMDIDILKVRVHLTNGWFIEVFYNLATAKTAFALISGGKRIYGKDNAKMGWHVHPLAQPERHVACAPVTFPEFLDEVEDILTKTIS